MTLPIAYATNPKPPIIKTVGKIASPSRPSVKLTAFEDPTITKVLINKNNGIVIVTTNIDLGLKFQKEINLNV